jgi:hypothetical protein
MSEHRLHSPPVVDSPVSVLKKISEQLGEVIARLYAIEHDVKDAADYQVRQDGARAEAAAAATAEIDALQKRLRGE